MHSEIWSLRERARSRDIWRTFRKQSVVCISQGELSVEEVFRISVDRRDRALGQRAHVEVAGRTAERHCRAVAHSPVQSLEQLLGRYNGRRILRAEFWLHGDNKKRTQVKRNTWVLGRGEGFFFIFYFTMRTAINNAILKRVAFR